MVPNSRVIIHDILKKIHPTPFNKRHFIADKLKILVLILYALNTYLFMCIYHFCDSPGQRFRGSIIMMELKFHFQQIQDLKHTQFTKKL